MQLDSKQEYLLLIISCKYNGIKYISMNIYKPLCYICSVIITSDNLLSSDLYTNLAWCIAGAGLL